MKTEEQSHGEHQKCWLNEGECAQCSEKKLKVGQLAASCNKKVSNGTGGGGQESLLKWCLFLCIFKRECTLEHRISKAGG